MEENIKPNVIILLGGPGSGKGTQGDKIEDKFGFKHISMGDVMRSKKEDPEVGDYNKELSSCKNTPLNHELSLRLLKNAMIENGWANNKFVLDGFHRKFDIYDLQFLEQINLICVIVLVPTSVEILEKRIRKRSKENENTEIHRKDDLEILNKRLKIYQTETQQVILYFKSMLGDRVYEVSCDNSKDEVFENIERILDNILF